MPGPLDVRNQLAALLTAVESEPRLAAEMQRAKREFFGAQPDVFPSESGSEAGAIRFAEWYLCERPSEFLGDVPVSVAAGRFGEGASFELLGESVVGVFLVQSTSGERPTVRDVADNRGFELCEVPEEIAIGDVLVGRLFASDEDHGAFVPSPAMTVVSKSPHFAIAFQRDLKNLAADRRLTQAELEHLLFRQGMQGADEPPPPLEHVEAELDKLLVAGGKTGSYTATAISDALRNSEHPSAIVESLLDELAFDTDIDLDDLRRVMLELLASVAASGAPEPEPEAEDDVGAGDAVDMKVRESHPKPFQPREGEKLGEQLARRIEEGLDGNEQIEALFADVENMLGEEIEEDDETIELSALDDGDLEPLVREFIWELDVEEVERARLDAFVAVQNRAPVPRTSIESIERDDLLRYLLQVWLETSPAERVSHTRASGELIQKFFDWVESTQVVDRRVVVDEAKSAFLADLDRLDRAAHALGGGDEPVGEPALYAVIGVDDDDLLFRAIDGVDELRTPDSGAGDDLREDDLIVGSFDARRGTFVGMAHVVPAALRHLLG